MLKKLLMSILMICGSLHLESYCCDNFQAPDKRLFQHDPFIIHSVPKCGTHFIQSVMTLMTNQECVMLPICVEGLYQALYTQKILATFEPYSPHFVKFLKLYNHKIIAIIRDPRDALISHVFYMRSYVDLTDDKTKRDFFTVGPDFDSLSLDEQIKALIIGNEHADSYLDYYKRRSQWVLDPYVLKVCYEDLIGSKGGGDDVIQGETIKMIANYIHLDLTEDRLQYMVDHMYRSKESKEVDGKTFKRNIIGNWKTFLNEENKELFKQKMGYNLIQLGYEKDLNW